MTDQFEAQVVELLRWSKTIKEWQQTFNKWREKRDVENVEMMTMVREMADEIACAQKPLSHREQACVDLRVPNSGTDWLDALIQKARELDEH